jgi:MFS family permease
LAKRIPTERLLKASVVFAIASVALAWLFTLWPVVLLGMLLTGVGIGIHWPLGVARVVRASGGMTDRASAASSIAGSIAIAIAPFALGVLSDTVGFHVAFLLVPALLAGALVILVVRPEPDVAAIPQ